VAYDCLLYVGLLHIVFHNDSHVIDFNIGHIETAHCSLVKDQLARPRSQTLEQKDWYKILYYCLGEVGLSLQFI